MNQYRQRDIIKKLNQEIYSNSNTLGFERCYYICANKSKFETLLQRNNQIVFGRRGTGKTTLFKAFTHFINNIYEEGNMNVACWYTRLDECIPTGIEANVDNHDNIVFFCIKKFLKKFVNFLYTEFERIEYRPGFNHNLLDDIQADLVRLSEIVENGSKLTDSITEAESSNQNLTTKTVGELNFSASNVEKKSIKDWLSINLNRNKAKSREIASTQEKKYVYRIDIDDIRERIESLLSKMGYDVFYVCIDEFTQIDRDIPFTIQPAVAQLIKQLLFNSETIVVKIASVWNESRMQNRQFNGNREGLELGHDIFRNDDLDLDIMFRYDNEKAYNFFKEYLVNTVTLYSEDAISDKERDSFGEYIIELLFAQGSFRHLICGSQGIPRVFGILLIKCLSSLRDNKSKITVEIVFDSIISHYTSDIRQRIPTSSPICVAVEDYVAQEKQRFFIVSSEDYDKAVNFFDGLVANGALHQCPSEQLPRRIRNKFKLFLVHYGNYLENFKNGRAELNYDVATIGAGSLFPTLPDNLVTYPEKYSIPIADEYLELVYCTRCHSNFAKTEEHMTNPVIKCPKCGSIIAYWR